MAGRPEVTDPTVPGRRPLDPGWRERHIQGQADGTMPPGLIPLTYEDGTPVLDSLGRPRMWSPHIEAATRKRPKSDRPTAPRARDLQRQSARAADIARVAAEVEKIRSEARLGILPPSGRLAAVDLDALIIAGPLGAVGLSASVLRSLQVLAQGRRHPVAALVAAAPWRDEAALTTAIEAARPRLAAVGLRVCRRKAGWRLASATL